MKKLILIATLLLTTPTLAEMTEAKCTAADGVPLTHSTTGKVYCKSPMIMNWWSANAWCDSFGASLVNLTTECANSFSGTMSCPNLTFAGQSSWAWTKNVPNSSSAYGVRLSSGQLDDFSRDNRAYAALCR